MVKMAYEQALYYVKQQGKSAPMNIPDIAVRGQNTVPMNSSQESHTQEKQSLHQQEDQAYIFNSLVEKINQENKRQKKRF